MAVREQAQADIPRLAFESGRGGRDLFTAETIASEDLLVPEPAVGEGTQLAYWNGSAYVLKPLKRWNGAEYVPVALKRWDGAVSVAV